MHSQRLEHGRGARPSPVRAPGHRVVVWRKYLVCFGGFYKAMREQRWFNDVHLFCFVIGLWSRLADVGRTAMGTAPAPRSACAMACHAADDTVLVYGGYAEIRAHNMAKSEGKAFTDGWLLHLRALADADSGGKRAFWERLSRRGQAPSARSGAAMCVHKNRALLFGGVHDTSGRGLAMTSVFYNELFASTSRLAAGTVCCCATSAAGSSAVDAAGTRTRRPRRRSCRALSTKATRVTTTSTYLQMKATPTTARRAKLTMPAPHLGPRDAEQLHNNLFGYIDASGNMVYEVCEPRAGGGGEEEPRPSSEPDAPKVTRLSTPPLQQTRRRS